MESGILIIKCAPPEKGLNRNLFFILIIDNLGQRYYISTSKSQSQHGKGYRVSANSESDSPLVTEQKSL